MEPGRLHAPDGMLNAGVLLRDLPGGSRGCSDSLQSAHGLQCRVLGSSHLMPCVTSELGELMALLKLQR